MGKFELMALPYAAEALEPVISRETIGFHHGKHLAAYVNNLNGLLSGSGFEEATLEEIVCKATGSLPLSQQRQSQQEHWQKPLCATSVLSRLLRMNSRRRVQHSSAAVGYGFQQIRTANSSSLRSRMRLILFRKA